MVPLILGGLGLGLNIFGMSRANKEARRAARAEDEAAERAREAGEFTAKQFETKTGQERAIGSREVSERKREGRILASDALAIGASSGAGGYESTIADIEGEAEYRMLTSLYNSEQSARDLEIAAEVSRREGADAGRAHTAAAAGYRSQARTIGIQGAADLFGGAMSLYDRYGRGYNEVAA